MAEPVCRGAAHLICWCALRRGESNTDRFGERVSVRKTGRQMKRGLLGYDERASPIFARSFADSLDRFQQMTHLQLFGAQVGFCGIGRFDFNGDAFDNVQPGLFHGQQLQGIIG